MLSTVPLLLLLLGRDTLQVDTTLVPDSARSVTIGGFVDTYYAWDTRRPRQFDRAYTTQSARHNEFGINLAHIELVMTQTRLRGRVALQAGTSVQANYAAEPRTGLVSGGDVSRHIQEATIGVRLTPEVWVDVGTYFSHIGLEGWVSRDNPTYTRSLIADYTPYYLAGARVTWQATSRLVAQLHVVNGWQNMSETNSDKAIGSRVDFQVSPALLVGWRTFVGNEMPDSAPGRLRVLQQGVARWTPPGWDVSLVLDAGRQARPGADADEWHGGALVGRRSLTSTTWLTGRAERLADAHGVLVSTPAGVPFRTSSYSLGLDMQLERHLLWRSEVRAYQSSHAIWPSATHTVARGTGLFVSSLALTF